jgi:protein tyrosine phosphatase (PTP) superfamily phosphohydrolase (DUF442 family)
MKRFFLTLALAAVMPLPAMAPATAAPAVAARHYSCPVPGDAMVVYRLAWVQPGRFLRSGAVVVDGDHLAVDNAHDRPAVQSAYRMLKAKYGVGAVVNLRAEAAEDRQAAVGAGMKYLHLPIADGAAPTPAQVGTFFGFLDRNRREKRVVLWHCAGGIGRTGVLAAMIRLREGWTVKEAAEEMFQMGLNYPQAVEHLPALNAFASALGKPGYYPPDWPFEKTSRQDYRAIVKTLPPLR